jgi:hypothetical protein
MVFQFSIFNFCRQADKLLRLPAMRRLAALAGLFVLVMVMLALFWRVYKHHEEVNPYTREQPALVQGWGFPQGSPASAEDFALNVR